MASSSFGFRQRVGTLNWSAVSSLDVDAVVAKVEVAALQDVLDTVTFSVVDASDLRHCTHETVAKLLRIFQFTVEYLLHCQETQSAVVHKVHERNAALTSRNQQLAQQVESLREDRRVYQRQLSVLKSTVGVLQPQPPRTVVEAFDNSKKKRGGVDVAELQPILDSVLKHEKESREMLRTLLEEQRSTFMKELELNHAAIASVVPPAAASSSSSSGATKSKEKTLTFADGEKTAHHASEALGGFATQFDDLLKQQRIQYEDIKQLSADNLKESLRLEKLKIDMDTKSKQLLKMEQEVHEREEDLKDRVRTWEQRQKRDSERTKAKEYLNSVDSLSSLRPPTHDKAVALRAQSRALSARGIKYRIIHALARQQTTAFRRWLDVTIERREAAAYAEQGRMRTAAAASHQRREQELLELLHAEKERALSDQAKFNAMALLSEQERARLQEAVDQAEETVLVQAQHIGRLQQQLQALQAAAGVAVDVADTAVMTSLEYLPKTPKQQLQPTTPTALQRTAAAAAITTTATTATTTTSTGTSTSNPPSPHPGGLGAGGRPVTFTFDRGPPTPRVPTPASTVAVPAAPPAPPVDPALYAKIQAKLGHAGSLEEAMARAQQRIAAAARLGPGAGGSKRAKEDAAGMQLAAEIAERLKYAPFRIQQ